MILTTTDPRSYEFQTERFQAQKELLIQAYTKIHKTLEELKQTQERLIESEKFAAMGEMIAGIVHEVNGPLGAIDGSQAMINFSLDSINNQVFEVVASLDEHELPILKELVNISSRKELFLSSEKSDELKDRYLSKLIEDDINPELCEEISRALVDINFGKDIERIYPILRRNNAVEILKYVKEIEEIDTACWIIANSAAKAKKLIERLKDYSYDHKGESKSISLKESIETILAIYQMDLISMEVSRDYEEVPNIVGDPDRVSQIWTNLISNALYASKKKGNKGTLGISVKQKDEYVIVSIKDNAGGMSAEVRKNIFEPFFTTKPQGEGTGLGLSIIKKIVEDQNGQILIESVENEGTTMIVKFKLNEYEDSF